MGALRKEQTDGSWHASHGHGGSILRQDAIMHVIRRARKLLCLHIEHFQFHCAMRGMCFARMTLGSISLTSSAHLGECPQFFVSNLV
jgi:hypothetical protein